MIKIFKSWKLLQILVICSQFFKGMETAIFLTFLINKIN